MTSNKPYFIKALYEWIVDNECTPYLLVDASADEVSVPDEHVRDGQIVLNVSPSAIDTLSIDNDCIHFNARFSGVARQIYLPIYSIIAIYAKENGQGMAFTSDDNSTESQPSSLGREQSSIQLVADAAEQKRVKKKPTLTIVK